MKPLALIIGAVCVILLLSGVLAAINDFRSTSVEEAYDITTGAEDTSANVTLVHELFGDNTISASITSDYSGDAPIAYSYTKSSQMLIITGLDASQTRRLTIEYDTDGLWDYPGASISARMWPLFFVLGVIGLIAAAIVSATRRGD
jgi:hypothetical protein